MPRLYVSANSHRIIFANAAAANDLGQNQTELVGRAVTKLFNTQGLRGALETNQHLQRTEPVTLNLQGRYPDLWDQATAEYVGQGLSRFVKLSINRSAAAAPANTVLGSYDKTARELLQHAIAQLCEHGGQTFSV
ncbi:MAG: PAS domain-containing protein, partial [Pseudomonadales bacterium]